MDRTTKIQFPFGLYEFDEVKHIHSLDGKALTGVTTPIGAVLAKPALIQWAANQVCESIKANALNDGGVYQVSEQLLEDSRTAHCKKKETGADIGTKVHNWCEKFSKGLNPDDDPEIKHITDNYKQWYTQHNIELIASEKNLVSVEWWVGGICDLIIRKEGKVYLADIKTSSGIYNEAFFQTAAYEKMAREMGLLKELGVEIDGHMIINLKKDGKFDETKDIRVSYGYERNVKAF